MKLICADKPNKNLPNLRNLRSIFAIARTKSPISNAAISAKRFRNPGLGGMGA